MIRWMAAFLLLTLSGVTNAATKTVFQLNAINLTNGWQVTGTITTDGSIGNLTAANIVDWNLKIMQTTDMVWTQKDSSDLNISGVSSDGKKIYVATSPDGVSDGGTLYFSRGGGGGRIPTSAVIADFTQLSANMGYGMGGVAGWQDEIGGLNFIGLNQRNNSQYRAASLLAGKPYVFLIHVPIISTSPILMTMFGTITTDGTVGPLLPQNIIAWNITARTQEISYITKANSNILSATGISCDGNVIKVDHAGGQFVIGVGGRLQPS